jgi:hypothetical protein
VPNCSLSWGASKFFCCRNCNSKGTNICQYSPPKPPPPALPVSNNMLLYVLIAGGALALAILFFVLCKFCSKKQTYTQIGQ